jgi:hypothetical protein
MKRCDAQTSAMADVTSSRMLANWREKSRNGTGWVSVAEAADVDVEGTLNRTSACATRPTDADSVEQMLGGFCLFRVHKRIPSGVRQATVLDLQCRCS